MKTTCICFSWNFSSWEDVFDWYYNFISHDTEIYFHLQKTSTAKQIKYKKTNQQLIFFKFLSISRIRLCYRAVSLSEVLKSCFSFIRNSPGKSTLLHESWTIGSGFRFLYERIFSSTIHFLNLIRRVSKQRFNFINTAVLGKQT